MPTTNIVPGTELRALLARFNLTGNKGARVAGTLLNYKTSTIQMMLSRGIRRNDFDLLERKLKEVYSNVKNPASL